MIWPLFLQTSFGKGLHAQVMRDICPQSIVEKQSETNRLEAKEKHDAEQSPTTTGEVVKLKQIISFDWAGSCGTVWGQVVGQGKGSRESTKTWSNCKIMAHT